MVPHPIYDDAGALLSPGELPPLKLISSGKVRDLYEVDADHLLMVATDRISAFDVVMLNGVPGKGKILNQLTVFWMGHLAASGVTSHHLVTDDPDKMPKECQQHAELLRGRSMLVRKLDMLPVEAIVRGYITGSGWADYQSSGSVCGVELPRGLRQCDRLPTSMFTPSTKADVGDHDENISVAQAAVLLGESTCKEVEEKALEIYKAACALAETRGIIVADTKMELGRDKSGTMVLGDEILTPDCSRYWPKASYEPGRDQDSFDKQYVRNYLKSIHFDKKTPIALPRDVVDKTIEKYVEIFKILTETDPVL